MGITSEPRGPPTPRYWPTLACAAHVAAGARFVHREFDVELARFAVEPARREIARGRTWLAGREHWAVGAGFRQRRSVCAGFGEKHLDVVVERSGDEVVQIVAREGDADQVRGQRIHLLDLQQTELQWMPYALDCQVGSVIIGQHRG
ncbi:hypothetical protein GGD41_003781 [Paraburkholderia bryophila]|uniref:Uncharacterized protein n=1 Tax=Paraburkholderia bryophila TaxID=420952 RepID=A0A7Y9WAS4_9BURK|nr:hypothetical protein [Paraburkholderia bryophila]